MKELSPTFPKIRLDQLDLSGLTSNLVPPASNVNLLTSTFNQVNLGDVKEWISQEISQGLANAYLARGTISFSDNWNSIVSPGTYKVIPGTRHPNTPPATSLWGTLLVFSSEDVITQIYVGHANANFWVRQYVGSWSRWLNLAAPPQVEVTGSMGPHSTTIPADGGQVTLIRRGLVFPYPVSLRLVQIQVCTRNANIDGAVFVHPTLYVVGQTRNNGCSFGNMNASPVPVAANTPFPVTLSLQNPYRTNTTAMPGDSVTAIFAFTPI